MSLTSQNPDSNWFPPWAPRFWSGMKAGDFFALLRENRFQIHPSAYPMTVLVGATSCVNSGLAVTQRLLYQRKIMDTQIEHPPIFVIGHWRSGTTLMHELLSLDDRFAYPNTVDTFAPNHSLISRHLIEPLLWALLPRKRPMDDMTVRVSSPQEDDFALCAYGAPTPYRRVAFPNRKGRDHLQLNLSLVDPSQRLELQQAIEHFLKTLTIRYQHRRIVLKSPPHTGRLKQLSQWFPGAKFVHLSRHPHKLVASTMRLWKLLDKNMAFQIANYDDHWLKKYIFECKDLMYQAYFQQRDSLPSNQLAEVSFESLVADPVNVMQSIYQQLELGDFAPREPAINNYFAARKSYQARTAQIDPEVAEDIDHHWQDYLEAFDYS